jgi:pimeloyl-ACP methyl ester carboxylesterase
MWERIEVDGRRTSVGIGGTGPPIVFLHGWALGSRAYRRAIRRLARRGCQVFAPALPGLGGTADLPGDRRSMAGYADWVDRFMGAVGIEEPAMVIGHSFGGGVATKLAHAHPHRVGYLVLLNSVGGVTDRPIWQWPLRIAQEMVPSREGIDALMAMRHDLVDNMIHHPVGLVRVGHLARTADLRDELAELRRRDLPVLALTTERDGVIPQPAFAALCRAIGTDGRVVGGRHSWLLSNPDTFDEVLANVIDVRVANHREHAPETRLDAVLDALAGTHIPTRTARSLVAHAPPLWLMSASAPVLAGDLALCHPRLEPGEVRAVARRVVNTSAVRLTVVAADRPGLLADTAGTIAAHGLSIAQASAATWPTRRLAMHALTVYRSAKLGPEGWERLGAALIGSDDGTPTVAPAVEVPPVRAEVTSYGSDGEDLSLVDLRAPDTVGLLWTVAEWLADHGISIQSVDASTDRHGAHDVFLVDGRFDSTALVEHLARGRPAHRVGAGIGAPTSVGS